MTAKAGDVAWGRERASDGSAGDVRSSPWRSHNGEIARREYYDSTKAGREGGREGGAKGGAMTQGEENGSQDGGEKGMAGGGGEKSGKEQRARTSGSARPLTHSHARAGSRTLSGSVPSRSGAATCGRPGVVGRTLDRSPARPPALSPKQAAAVEGEVGEAVAVASAASQLASAAAS
ncbi:hypothetical protein AXG93_1052s1130 [Marchantia polymorpha subsp. ruderalis]|uniref:Uncharacterized protein n=1 Tax=Marchantia polymorpha subsp. ruderalis TaxID=1480154 RepID=A0A176VU11_MARPO|nr:hypothetical protein AXG93_1052s1130 [Marchantia polymorpha subsp. ruderalis]